MSRIHRTRDGKELKISEMTDEHLKNTILLLKRKAEEGIYVLIGGGVDSEDIWFDQDFVSGEEALEAMGYKHYAKEYSRRLKKVSKKKKHPKHSWVMKSDPKVKMIKWVECTVCGLKSDSDILASAGDEPLMRRRLISNAMKKGKK